MYSVVVGAGASIVWKPTSHMQREGLVTYPYHLVACCTYRCSTCGYHYGIVSMHLMIFMLPAYTFHRNQFGTTLPLHMRGWFPDYLHEFAVRVINLFHHVFLPGRTVPLSSLIMHPLESSKRLGAVGGITWYAKPLRCPPASLAVTMEHQASLRGW